MNYLLIFGSAILLISFFKGQKTIKSPYYFAFSDVIGDINTVKLILGRISVIIIHNLAVIFILKYVFYKNEFIEILLISNFLGTLLIVWPIIYAPEHNLLLLPSLKTKLLLYLYYILFIGGSIILAFISNYLGDIIFGNKTFKEFWEEDIVRFFISGAFLIATQGATKPLANKVSYEFNKDRGKQNSLYK